MSARRKCRSSPSLIAQPSQPRSPGPDGGETGADSVSRGAGLRTMCAFVACAGDLVARTGLIRRAGSGRSTVLRMQLSNPTQSTRWLSRPAFRLHICKRHSGGFDWFTYFSERFIAFDWAFMHFCCHWQLMPILRATGSLSGARARASSASPQRAKDTRKNAHLTCLPMPLAEPMGNCRRGKGAINPLWRGRVNCCFNDEMPVLCVQLSNHAAFMRRHWLIFYPLLSLSI